MLKKGKVYYYYTSGFSPGFKKFSPGSILIFKIVENAVQNGIKQINFLKGGEEYKYKWGAKDNYTYKIIFNNKDRVLS
jgi:CelD/BcsL family acetyltransferase involved in cellulose biosynthesis